MQWVDLSGLSSIMGISQWNDALGHMERKKSVPLNSPKGAVRLLESIAEGQQLQGQKTHPRQGHAPIDESRFDCVNGQVENALSSYIDFKCETRPSVDRKPPERCLGWTFASTRVRKEIIYVNETAQIHGTSGPHRSAQCQPKPSPHGRDWLCALQCSR